MRAAVTDRTEQKLRVLQAGPTSFPGGVANSIKMLCMSLRALGHEVILFTNGGDDVRELETNGVECQITELSQGPKALLHSAWQLRRLLKSFQPEVVHVHGRSTALRCILAGRKADWFTLHNTALTHQVGSYDTGLIRKYLSPWRRNFFVLDPLGAEYLQREFGVSAETIVRVFNGVDCERFYFPSAEERAAARAQFEVQPEEIFVVFVGRLHPSKQPHAVVDAAVRAVQCQREKVKFAIIGDGELRDSVSAAVKEKGVSSICRLYPWMNPLKAYFAADLVVMPSQFEGYPLVPAEAISTGCPVLRSRTGGSSHMIREGVSGFECDIEPEKFVERLFEVLEDPERLRAMRSQAREFALAHLDATNGARLISSAYWERMKHSSGGRSPAS